MWQLSLGHPGNYQCAETNDDGENQVDAAIGEEQPAVINNSFQFCLSIRHDNENDNGGASH